MNRAATPGRAVGGRRGPERGPGTAEAALTMAVTREERIRIVMRRQRTDQTRMGIRLRKRGVRGAGPQMVCGVLNRRLTNRGRGRGKKTLALLAEMEAILGLEVDDERA